MPYTVLFVDDHDLIRQGLRRAFDSHPDFSVMAEASSVRQAMKMAADLQPDVVVCDIRLPDGSGLDAVRQLREQRPDMGLVVLTMYAGDEHLFAALEAGASAFVPKDAPSDDVVAAARHAAVSPRSFTAPDLASAMRRRMTPAGPRLQPARDRGPRTARRGLRRRPHRAPAVHQRVHDEDTHLQDLRQAGRRKPGPGDHEGDPVWADYARDKCHVEHRMTHSDGRCPIIRSATRV